MADVVDAATRSRMMRGIRSCNTKPEKTVRSFLHVSGFRFARSDLNLPGRPDVVLPRWKVAVFVNGCFWHFHGCRLSKLPSSNTDFWLEKLSKNRHRDVRVMSELLASGWRVLTVWECALRGKSAEDTFTAFMDEASNWIRGDTNVKSFVITGAIRTELNNDDKCN